MGRQKRCNYTDDFKEKIAKLVVGGQSKAQVSKEYGLSKATVHIWAATYERASNIGGTNNGNDEVAELTRLRNENMRLTVENSRLKASVFSNYVKEQF